MKTLGLTGGMGMGKSSAAGLLRDLGVQVVDTDAIAHQLVEPGQPALAEIQNHFGPDIINAHGELRRDELGRRVFADPSARTALEGILHPRIRQVWQSQVAAWNSEGIEVGVVVIPLLFETKAETAFDSTICVACTTATQLERLKPRGWSHDQIAQRIQAQWPVEKKMASASFVVWSEGEISVLTEQLRRIFVNLGLQSFGSS
jgi:dephospho-CoA kinase